MEKEEITFSSIGQISRRGIHVLKVFNNTTFLTQSQLCLDIYMRAKIFQKAP